MLRPTYWIRVFIVGAGIFVTGAHADDTVVRSFAGGSAASMVGIVADAGPDIPGGPPGPERPGQPFIDQTVSLPTIS